MSILHSPSLTFDLLDDQSWKLTHKNTGLEVFSHPVKIDCNIKGTKRSLTLHKDDTSVSAESSLVSSSGQHEVIRCQYDSEGISLSVTYALSATQGLFFLKFKLENHTSTMIHCGEISLMDNSFNGNLKFPSSRPVPGCFVNGWQSWSISGTYSAASKQRIPGLRFIQGQQWHDIATPVPRSTGVFTSDFFTVLIDKSSSHGILAGFLSQKQQFGHAEIDLRDGEKFKLKAAGDSALIPPGESMETDWAVIQFIDFNDPDPLRVYLDAAARKNNVAIKSEIPVGWCSWYQYYTKINSENLNANIRKLEGLKTQLPIDLVQIDDGYQRAVGDWLEFKPEFSGGLGSTINRIRSSGFTPGLWLAPFIVHPKSRLYNDHREMLLLDKRGKPVNSAFNWNRITTALDLTHPASKDYIRNVIDTVVNKWGFPYLKLDFLYAGALPGNHYDQTKTRAQVFDQGMKLIRETAGDETYLLGCGAPIGSMIGHVDAMRIGADVSSDWKPKYKGIELLFPHEPNLPSVKNAMQNTVTRAWFHYRWWMNDPDCMLVRTTTNLTEEEVCTQASITAMSGGLVLLSDDLAEIPVERMKILQKILPVIGKTPQVIDWHEEFTPSKLRIDLENSTGLWHLISFTNWLDTPVRPVLCTSDYHLECENEMIVSSFWDSKISIISDNFQIGELPPHATWVAAVRNLSEKEPQYAGSNLHFSQGLEVKNWTQLQNQIKINFEVPMETDGACFLFVPADDIHVRFSNNKVLQLNNPLHHYNIPLHFSNSEKISIEY